MTSSKRVLTKSRIAVLWPIAATNGLFWPHSRIIHWAHMSQPPNGISIGLAVCAGLTNMTKWQTDRQTDWPRYSVCSNRPLSLDVAAMRPNNKSRFVVRCVSWLTTKYMSCFSSAICNGTIDSVHGKLPVLRLLKCRFLCFRGFVLQGWVRMTSYTDRGENLSWKILPQVHSFMPNFAYNNRCMGVSVEPLRFFVNRFSGPGATVGPICVSVFFGQ